jgi:hypothetical protein
MLGVLVALLMDYVRSRKINPAARLEGRSVN